MDFEDKVQSLKNLLIKVYNCPKPHYPENMGKELAKYTDNGG